ncbi:Arrestin domain-containing protein [Elsinoe australis]|uniref:Arrestin domain-containing protein n=1 Tax=Elsinoe australis TaxID=40998 RepID=A0A2P7YJL3_9PEZI|nr:Arrestin domain-containing protein [Elsinoe australis]
MNPNYQQPMEFAQWEAMKRKAYQLQGQEEKQHSERIAHLCVQFKDERNTPLWKSSKGGSPRYLHRFSRPNSHATNKQWAKSQAVEDRLESAKVDIFARRSSEKDRLEAAEDINDHLRSELW